MSDPRLPHSANQTIEYLAYLARGHGGTLQRRVVQRFKAALVSAPARWDRDLVPVIDFERSCLAAGLSPADAGELAGLLRRLHEDNHMRVASRSERVYPLDVPDDWYPPDRDDGDPR